MANRKQRRANKSKTPKQSKSQATKPVADESKVTADVAPNQEDVLYKLLDAKIEIPNKMLGEYDKVGWQGARLNCGERTKLQDSN